MLSISNMPLSMVRELLGNLSNNEKDEFLQNNRSKAPVLPLDTLSINFDCYDGTIDAQGQMTKDTTLPRSTAEFLQDLADMFQSIGIDFGIYQVVLESVDETLLLVGPGFLSEELVLT
jgi:hypothetical protein